LQQSAVIVTAAQARSQFRHRIACLLSASSIDDAWELSKLRP